MAKSSGGAGRAGRLRVQGFEIAKRFPGGSGTQIASAAHVMRGRSRYTFSELNSEDVRTFQNAERLGIIKIQRTYLDPHALNTNYRNKRYNMTIVSTPLLQPTAAAIRVKRA